MKLTGFVAIEDAEKDGLRLNKHPDSTCRLRVDFDIPEAEAIASADPDLIWLEVSDDRYYGAQQNFEPCR
ncbi:MAG TPA: hypothetical protein VKU02_00180 [Gemmataceae bacterium]|nr:hypothetical protein [Gemmataceae bacterium]